MTGLDHSRFFIFVLGFEPRISRVLGERHNQARPYEQASNEDRTRDLALTKRMLCQLSYRGGGGVSGANLPTSPDRSVGRGTGRREGVGYWRNRKRASLARTRYWDRNPDTP